MNKIEVEFSGMLLLEPMAFLLNWVLMFQCLYYYKKINSPALTSFSLNWKYFYLFFGISTLFGGISHLFFHYLGMPGKIPGWITGIIAVTFMELAIIETSNNKYYPTLKFLILAKFIGTLIWLSFNFNFNVVILHSASMGVFILIGYLVSLNRKRHTLTNTFIGLLLLIVAVVPRVLQFDFHEWFNRDDIGHVCMSASLIFFYQGVVNYEKHQSLLAAVSNS